MPGSKGRDRMAAAIMATRRNAVEGSQFSQLNAAALSAERELALLQGTKSSILLEDEPTRQKEAIRLCDQARRNNATFLALPLDLHEVSLIDAAAAAAAAACGLPAGAAARSLTQATPCRSPKACSS